MENNLQKNKFSAKRLAMLAVLCALGLVSFMIESLFPPLFIPGAKMGVSNVFSMLALFVLGPIDALIVVVVRTTLGSLLCGNASSLVYSLTAGLASVCAATLLERLFYPSVSVVAISVVSAVVHNVTQNVVFCLVSQTPQMIGYLPYLVLCGILAGIIVGVAVWLVLKALPQKYTDFRSVQ